MDALADKLKLSKNKLSIELNEEITSKVRELYMTDLSLSVMINYQEENEADTYITMSSANDMKSRVGKFIGDEHRITLGSVEMALDCVRRYFDNLPFDEKSDFEIANL